MFEYLTFKDPGFLWLLLVIPIMIGWYFFREKRKTNPAVKTSLGGVLRHAPVSFRQRLIHLPFILRVVVVAILVFVLANPQLPKSWREIETEGIDIVMALDISTSMLAKDFEVNRMEASKDVAKEFVQQRKNDRIGIVLFSGRSFTLFPLTTDHEVLINLLANVKSGMITDGTAIGLGLANSVRNLQNSFAKSKVIILLTDGVNNSGNIDPMDAGIMARDLGIRVYAVDIRENAEIMSRAGEGVEGAEVLREIASMTGGQYFTSSDKKALRRVYDEIDRIEKSKIKTGDVGTRNAYMPFAFVALLILIVEIVLKNTFLKVWP